MTRGRKALPAPETVDSGVTDDQVRRVAEKADVAELVAQSNASATSAAAPLFTLVGRAQMAALFGNVSDLAAVKSFISAKAEFSKIKDLELLGPNGERKRVSDFDEFCRLAFGRGERRLRQISAAINTLGEDLYETAQQIGFKARDYAALQALPADDQEAVKVALAGDDKDAAIEILAERLAARKAETVVLEEKVADKDAYIASREQTIDKLRAKTRWKPSPDSEAKTAEEQSQLEGLHEACRTAMLYIRRAGNAIATCAGSQNKALREAAEGSSAYLARLVVEDAEQAGIAIDFAGIFESVPVWARTSALDDAGAADADAAGAEG
jgi:hypothetical protein